MTARVLNPVLLPLLLIALAILGLAFSPRFPNGHANPASFTLFGRIFPLSGAGWGFTSSTIASPGPDLKVAPGETVTLQLTAADAPTGHNWGVDYNNNTFSDPGEPLSPIFSGTTVTYTFTATTTPGNYFYYCFIHGPPMFGHFIVSAPDVAVSAIATSRNFAYSGVTSNPIQVNVTASNLGGGSQTFFVSAKANTTLIGNQTVTIAPGGSTVVTFQWNAAALIRGNYIITAQATKVPGETNTSNNAITGGVFTIRLKGDVNGDCRVDIVDLATVGANFGKSLSTAGFNPNADLNNDGVINIVDLVVVGGSFGLTC